MIRIRRRCLACLLAAVLGGVGLTFAPAQPPAVRPPSTEDAPFLLGPPRAAGPETAQPQSFADLLGPDVMPIDLPSALRLAGVKNPQLLIARQRVLEAVAQRQLAAAQVLPNLNLGTSYDDHNGNLQQSSGNILKVDRSNIYVGAGANAIAAGSVSIPGVVWNANVSQTLYTALVARAVVAERRFESRAVENEMLRRVAVAYTDLLRAEGTYVIYRLVLAEAQEVERVTIDFAKQGVGRQADADRASSERQQRAADVLTAEGEILQASARLAELLTLPPTTRLHVMDGAVVPCPVVPDVMPLPELLTVAVLNRPELGARQAAIRQALLNLDGARLLVFSPNIFVGLSYGAEAGGSNLVAEPTGTSTFAMGQPRFSGFNDRLDLDAIGYWSLLNLGVGNTALINTARSRLSAANYRYLEQLNRVRMEVANAYARSHARFAQIMAGEQAVRDALVSFESDSKAVAGFVAKPIELLESLRLLARARSVYLNAIIDYNLAQLDLYVALGQPPADTLARPVPPNFVPPGTERPQPQQPAQKGG